jgi:predicted dehydrogenase
MNNINIAFIGVGNFINAFHLKTAKYCQWMTVHALADLNEQLLAKHAAALPVGYTTTDYRRVLDDPRVDLVVIGTKQDTHAQLIVESLDAGKWVYCEKPMAQTQEETQAVLAAEARSTGRLAVGFNRRFSPAYREVKRLFADLPRPWFLNYRLMLPNPQKHAPDNFYHNQPHILYEGCHILDLGCWLMDACPTRVYMTGDRLVNNCCILEFEDGSQMQLMCGGMGSYCMPKEYMELFHEYHAITVNDFVDMRVRGFEGEFDRVYGTFMQEHEAEVMKFGFDFYDTYRAKEIVNITRQGGNPAGMPLEYVHRPTPVPFNVEDYSHQNPDCWSFQPDKGWEEALKHFARCRLEDRRPHNADGLAGARATQLALDLLKSFDQRRPVATRDVQQEQESDALSLLAAAV